MILVDSPVWVDHLRQGSPHLTALLEARRVLGHPFVAGEIALGNLGDRRTTLWSLTRLPQATVATHDEALALLETEKLSGLGIGYVDLHVLAAARLTPEATIWTRDRRLHDAAERLGLAALDLPVR